MSQFGGPRSQLSQLVGRKSQLGVPSTSLLRGATSQLVGTKIRIKVFLVGDCTIGHRPRLSEKRDRKNFTFKCPICNQNSRRERKKCAERLIDLHSTQKEAGPFLFQITIFHFVIELTLSNFYIFKVQIQLLPSPIVTTAGAVGYLLSPSVPTTPKTPGRFPNVNLKSFHVPCV